MPRKMVTPTSSLSSNLSSAGQNSVKYEDGVSHGGSAQQQTQTRHASKLATVMSVSRTTANPEVLPQVRSGVGQPHPEDRHKAAQDEPSCAEDSQDEYESTTLKTFLQSTRTKLTKQGNKLFSANQTIAQLKDELKKEKEKERSKREEYQKKIKN